MRKSLVRLVFVGLVAFVTYVMCTEPVGFYVRTAYRSHQDEEDSGYFNFDQDGNFTISLGDDGKSIVVTDRTAARVLASFPYERCTRAALSRNGRTLAIMREGYVQVWDVAGAKELSRIDKNARLLAFSPDGQTLAIQGFPIIFCSQSPYELTLWDVNRNQGIACEKHNFYFINSLAFSSDGSMLCAAGSERAAYWCVSDGQLTYEFDLRLVFNATGVIFIFGSTVFSIRVCVRVFALLRRSRRQIYERMLRDAEDRQIVAGRSSFFRMMDPVESDEPNEVGRRIKGIIARLGPYGSPPKPICTRS